MANVTDSAFRAMFAKYGKPDVTWTEFVSADGLCSPKGKVMLMRDLAFTTKERPIVAQLFTGHPEAMKKAAQMVAKLGFDGIDINMGCPDRSVEKQGGGAAMIKDPKNAIAVLEAARKGWIEVKKQKAKSKSESQKEQVPITIKTRIGYNSIDWKWLRLLLEQNLPVLTIHLRTRKEMSDVPAHWELMTEIVKLRDEVAPQTLIIGNGDVRSLTDGNEKIKKYGCDGVMIGRGIFGKPWFFAGKEKEEGRKKQEEKTPEERLKIMLEHAKLFAKTFNGKKKGSHKNFAVMKKHFKAYVSGWDGAKELRVKLMEVETIKDVEKIVNDAITQ